MRELFTFVEKDDVEKSSINRLKMITEPEEMYSSTQNQEK
jgi:hypothetical protein